MVESPNGFQEASCACLVPRNADSVSEDVAIKGCPLVGGNRGRGGGGRGWRLRPAGFVGFGAGRRCDNQRRNDGRADPHRGCGGHAGRRRRFRASSDHGQRGPDAGLAGRAADASVALRAADGSAPGRPRQASLRVRRTKSGRPRLRALLLRMREQRPRVERGLLRRVARTERRGRIVGYPRYDLNALP